MQKDDRFYLSNSRFVPSGTTVLPGPNLDFWGAKCAVDYIETSNPNVADLLTTDEDGVDHLIMLIPRKALRPARTTYQIESQQAANYGTYIHTMCQYSLENDIELEMPSICPKCHKEYWDETKICYCYKDVDGIKISKPHETTNKFMKGLWKWKTKHNVKIIAMEHEVLSKWYGGRLDLVCEMDSYWMTKAWCKKYGIVWYKGIEKQRVVVLVDFKTANSDTYRPNWKYQLAGYRQAWNNREAWDNKEIYPKVQHHGILKFNKKKGTVNYKDCTIYDATRPCTTKPRKADGKLPTEKYMRDYETDLHSFMTYVSSWWSTNRGIRI